VGVSARRAHGKRIVHHIVARDRAAIISSAFGMSAASCVSRAAVAVAPRAPPRASSSRRPTTRRVRAPPPRRDASASATESTAAESTTAAEEAPVARSLEFMVEMACGKCVAKVEHALAHVPGIDAVAATLSTNSVRVVTATASTDAIVAAIERAGFNCRLIGQGDVGAFGEELARRLGTNLRTLRQSLAAVAEFKGSAYGHGSIAGVVRFVAADERNTLIEGGLRGLTPFATYAMTVRAYGDTTRGLETVGEVYDAADDGDDDDSGAFYALVPMRSRRRGERRSLRTLSPGASLRPSPLAFNPDTPRRLSTSTDAFQLHPDVRSYRTALERKRRTAGGGGLGDARRRRERGGHDR